MKNKNTFGVNMKLLANNRTETTEMLAEALNSGHLGLFLGAGVSTALNIPGWYSLLESCLEKSQPGEKMPPKASAELKKIAQNIKRHYGDNIDKYLDDVEQSLYKNVHFDFGTINKEMLMALTALFVGRTRGSVRSVITYNFDSVLEWYLTSIGLSVATMTNNFLLHKVPDVEILHIHGYLPHSSEFGERSNDILLTKRDFESRQIGAHYYKKIAEDYYQRHLFLTIGLSAQSVVDDICPYLVELHNSNQQNEIERDRVFGVALLSSSSPNGGCVDDDQEVMMEAGIVPMVLANHNEVPTYIFALAQTAMKHLR